MTNNLVKSEGVFAFKFEGGSQIDAVVLANTITHMATLTKELSKAEDPEAYVKLNVTALSDGSFNIDFSAILEFLPSLTQFTQGASFVNTIISSIKGIFEIKRHLAGKEPKAVEKLEDGKQITVINQDDEAISVPVLCESIFKNVTIDNSVINITQNVYHHNPQGGFSVIDQDGVKYFGADDVDKMKVPTLGSSLVTCYKNTVEAELVIKKPAFYGSSRWEFYYGSKTIFASVEDETFLEDIHNGVSIRRNDFIRCILEVLIDMDADGLPVDGTERYSIKKVHGGIMHDFKENETKLMV